MIENPFLLDPGFEDLIASGAFRQRVYDKFCGGRGSEVLTMCLLMQIPTAITLILGFTLDPKIFIGTAIFGGIVTLVSVIMGLVWLGNRGKRRRMHRLAFDGELVTGHILSCQRKCYHGSSYKVEVHFAVTAPTGKEVTWTEALERDDLLNEKLPPPGWPVLVLMVDETLFFML